MSAKTWDQKAMSVLVALVALLAVPTLWSWFAPPGVPVGSSGGPKSARGLASVGTPAPPSEKSGKLSRPVTLTWDLPGGDLSREIEGTHLRLKGATKNNRLDSVTNGSNGFTASVFLNGADFTTDFIELNEGVNEIQIEGADAKGAPLSRKLRITRRASPGGAQNE